VPGMRKLPLTAAEELLEIIMRRYERARPSHSLCEIVCTAAAGQTEFLSTCLTIRLQNPARSIWRKGRGNFFVRFSAYLRLPE